MHFRGDPIKPQVLLLGQTGVAAIKINVTTIHSRLSMNCKGQFYLLNDKQKVFLSKKLSEVRLVITDKMSMVSRKLFVQINQRLIEIFGYIYDMLFAGLSVIVSGDLNQLLPLNPPAIYTKFEDITYSSV